MMDELMDKMMDEALASVALGVVPTRWQVLARHVRALLLQTEPGCIKPKSLSASLAGDSELDCKAVSISVVGAGRNYELIEGPAVQRFLDELELDAQVGGLSVGAGAGAEGEAEDVLEVPDL
jgi:hypothetical protein